MIHGFMVILLVEVILYKNKNTYRVGDAATKLSWHAH